MAGDAVFPAIEVISESSNSASSCNVGLSMMAGIATTTPASFKRAADSLASRSECPPSSKKSEDGSMVDSSTERRRDHKRATTLFATKKKASSKGVRYIRQLAFRIFETSLRGTPWSLPKSRQESARNAFC